MTSLHGPIEGVMFDLDGTLALGDRRLGGYQLLPGAAQTLGWLTEHSIPYVVLTNGSAHIPRKQAPKLRDAGLPVPDERLMTPSTVAASVLPREGVKRALLLGVQESGVPLEEAGVELVTAGDGAKQVDAVYIAWHPDCRMHEIEAAARAIWDGARLYVASDVPFFATREGKTPGYSSAIAAAVTRMAKTEIHVVGKPSRHAFGAVEQALGVPAARIAVVGDDPVCEIAMARDMGGIAIATLTGVTTAEQWKAMPDGTGPHSIVGTISDLIGLIRGSRA
jgi:4-nitrophenyl phosphatase